MSLYVDTFINNTSHFQINDARQIPIIIPSKAQLKVFKTLFDKATKCKVSCIQLDELDAVERCIDGLVNELYGI